MGAGRMWRRDCMRSGESVLFWFAGGGLTQDGTAGIASIS